MRSGRLLAASSILAANFIIMIMNVPEPYSAYFFFALCLCALIAMAALAFKVALILDALWFRSQVEEVWRRQAWAQQPKGETRLPFDTETRNSVSEGLDAGTLFEYDSMVTESEPEASRHLEAAEPDWLARVSDPFIQARPKSLSLH
jgi:hypothetical protein